jgi:fructokinase
VTPLAVGIGEFLWDVFPGGRRLGGAPANFAYHASRLGCRGAVVSRVGDDALGREALAALDAMGVDRSRVQTDPSRPTGTVTVTVGPGGHPAYVIHEDAAWDALEDPGPLDADALCFGTLASRTGTAIRRVLEKAGPRCLRVFDVNLRQSFYTPETVRAFLGLCDVLKLNEDELPIVAAMAGVPAVPQALRARFGLKLVALTLGSRGSLLCTATERLEAPALPVRVVDTVGAGDAFTAALVSGLLHGVELKTVQRRATALSAFVCGQDGATPDTRAFLASDPVFR